MQPIPKRPALLAIAKLPPLHISLMHSHPPQRKRPIAHAQHHPRPIPDATRMLHHPNRFPRRNQLLQRTWFLMPSKYTLR